MSAEMGQTAAGSDSPEDRVTLEVLAGGSTGEAVGGIAAVALAIVALLEVGAAVLLSGTALTSRMVGYLGL